MVNNDNLKSLILKGPKLREPRSCNWHSNFIYIMISIEEYTRRWAKHEKEDLDILSECTKSILCMLKLRIKWVKRTMKTIYPSIFDNVEEYKNKIDTRSVCSGTCWQSRKQHCSCLKGVLYKLYIKWGNSSKSYVCFEYLIPNLAPQAKGIQRCKN